MTVLLTGATGTVGSSVLSLLSAHGQPVRVMVPTPEEADDLRGFDAHVVLGDFDRPETLDDALLGTTAALLVAPAGPHHAARELAFLDAVDRSPDRPHVVKLGALGWQHPRSRLTQSHAEVIRRMQGAGIAYTVLAPNAFMQDILRYAAMVQEESALLLPAGDGAVSHVDARDVAAVAAHVLGRPQPHEGASYPVTGPEAITYAEVAERMTKVLGKEVGYVDSAPDEVRSRLLGYGWGEWTVDGMLEVYRAYAEGAAAEVTDEVQKATGRPARDLDSFLRDHQAAFRTV